MVTADGSPEYAARLQSARAKFEQKYGPAPATASAKPSLSSPSPAPSAAPSPSSAIVSEEDKKSAEALKNAGNALLAQNQIEGAIAKYSQAINLNPKEHVYYANR